MLIVIPTTFHDIVERILMKLGLVTFPCNEHKDYVITYSIKYYVNMQLRQYTRWSKQEKVKEKTKKTIVEVLYIFYTYSKEITR